MARTPLPTPPWPAADRAARLVSALISAALVGLVGLTLALGLRADAVIERGAALIAIRLLVTPPPRPTPPPHRGAATVQRPAGAAPRQGPHQVPLAVTAPAPPIILAPPIPAAPLAGNGEAGDAAGQGTGGVGTGAGGQGQGDDGDTNHPAMPAEQIKGHLSPHDFPHGLITPGAQVSVRVGYTIRADGRVDGCRVLAPSGYAQVDAMVCRLITDRFRYRPARDRAGHPVDQPVIETHAWARRPDS